MTDSPLSKSFHQLYGSTFMYRSLLTLLCLVLFCSSSAAACPNGKCRKKVQNQQQKTEIMLKDIRRLNQENLTATTALIQLQRQAITANQQILDRLIAGQPSSKGLTGAEPK